MKVTIVAGARPNFMKVGPIINAIQKLDAELTYRLVHTGQHYSAALSDTFFTQLGIPQPHSNLEVGSGSHAGQTAQIMLGFEQELIANPTDLVLVVGDVNSTMAATLVAKKMDIAVAHVEAGLRSYDLEMPEEINRMVTDSIADYFFTTTEWAGENLRKMGANSEKIFFVGNTMIDTLVSNLDKLKPPIFWDTYKLSKGNYLLLTLHRPSNVDNPNELVQLLTTIADETRGQKLIFPVHPRTASKLESATLSIPSSLHMVEPQGYHEFIYLLQNSKGVVTDSGGIQEESTFLHIPCITLRKNTERPETISMGTNVLVGSDRQELKLQLSKLANNNWKQGAIPPLWDGKTGERIAILLINEVNKDLSLKH